MFVKFQLPYYSVTSDSACVGSGSGSGFGSVFGSELEWLDDELLEELDELLYALDNQLPGKAQELRDAKNRAEQNLLNEKE